MRSSRTIRSGKIPTLIKDDGTALYDSRVICEYLNSLSDGHLLPESGPRRWAALVDQALADGLMDAAVLTRYENAARPEALRWPDWIAGQLDKVSLWTRGDRTIAADLLPAASISAR